MQRGNTLHSTLMSTGNDFDVLVIGGGPAGIAASVRAAGFGLHVGIVDDNPDLGGQIWRGASSETASEAEPWLARLRSAEVETFCGTRVFHLLESGRLLAEGPERCYELRYRRLILATGARERFLPFPGWTLPNVMGAGGLQALVKSGLPIANKRIVVAGTGPLLVAVAAHLRQHGALILAVCEQASWAALGRFSRALLSQPQKIRQAWTLRRELSTVPYWANSWPVAAKGKDCLETVTVSRNGQIQKLACDYLACGFHLVPNYELAAVLGCRMENGCVQVDDFQQTSVADVFCAGEPTGIGGWELALAEGEIAGLAAARQKEAAIKLQPRRNKLRRFAHALERTFALRKELAALPVAETIVCRCEDVTFARLKECASWRAAKLYTRCGMGPCQGRVCGPATHFLFHWTPDSVRPPVFPTSMQNLEMDLAVRSEPQPMGRGPV
jgi:D-hydroxyproline dehydrogenase subunit alpha